MGPKTVFNKLPGDAEATRMSAVNSKSLPGDAGADAAGLC